MQRTLRAIDRAKEIAAAGTAAEPDESGAEAESRGASASCCINFHQSIKYSSTSVGPHAQSDAATTAKLSTRVSGALAVRACVRNTIAHAHSRGRGAGAHSHAASL